MDAYRTPDEQFDGLPGYDFEPHYVEQDGLRMHYLDEGSGPPVLLLHGEPTWSYLYRTIIPELTPSARAIAPDYFGFGRSDKPLRLEDYSYDFHTGSIARLVEELDLRDLTVVVQDWGGPIGLRLAVEHPDRVARLVIMNTGIGGGRPPSEEWLRFRDLLRRVGTDIDPRPARPHLGRAADERRGRGGLQRAVAGTRVEGGRPRVPRARPDLARPSRTRPRTCAVREQLAPLGEACARPLLRLRSDLLAARRRADRRPHPGRARARDRRRARATSCRRTRARRSAGGSPRSSAELVASASTSTCGSQSSQRGRYQFRSPRSSIAAGTSTERIRVASIRSATATPKPICWNITSSPVAKPAKTTTMIRAAPVISRAVVRTPNATASLESPVCV